VQACVQQWQGVDCLKGGCSSALRTWERRLENKHVTCVVPLLSATLTAGYLLDPLYAKVNGKDVLAPDVPGEHEEAAHDLIERIEAERARDKLVAFVASGYSGTMAEPAKGCATAASCMSSRTVFTFCASPKSILSQQYQSYRRYASATSGVLALCACRQLATTCASTIPQAQAHTPERNSPVQRRACQVEL
jgi:hypothetical protein